MTCKHVQHLIVMDLYNELSELDQEDLRSHLNQCSTCQEYAEENQQLFNLLSLEETGEIIPRWDECWHKIEERVAIEDRKGWSSHAGAWHWPAAWFYWLSASFSEEPFSHPRSLIIPFKRN